MPQRSEHFPSVLLADNPKRNGTYHKIEIELSGKDYKAQARKGYYAIEPEN